MNIDYNGDRKRLPNRILNYCWRTKSTPTAFSRARAPARTLARTIHVTLTRLIG
jgi:hypothetical protein